ncbi:MAG: ABC transporter ATP-binding protein [Spirochaetales bacterium]|nr:ABC transporter ATP-binding protein [Spirochaetales bacterium]
MNDQLDENQLLSINNCSFSIKDTLILNSVSFSAGTGDFIGLIGPNGAGKTTLLRIIDRILQPVTGSLIISGKGMDEYSIRELSLKVSFMAQDADAVLAFPVLEVILMGRYPYLAGLKGPGPEDIEKAERALAYVGLQRLKNRFFNELSSGERQLVLFAKMLVQETDIILLDEPTSNLDIRHKDKIFSMAGELAREKKLVIAAIHDLNEASQFCSRLILLDKGEIVSDGRPEEVLVKDTLDRVYGVKTRIGLNDLAGTPVVNIVPVKKRERTLKVHVIGGAGSAINITRELYRLGYNLTGGIAHGQDSDARLWEALGIEHAVVPVFDNIGEEEIEAARQMVQSSDICILCVFPFGPGNEGNLALASAAGKLYILAGKRTFFSNRAEDAFNELCLKGLEIQYGDLVTLLEAEN